MDFEIVLERLRYKPGDMLLVTVDIGGRSMLQAQDYLREVIASLKSISSDSSVKIVVIPKGIEIEVVGEIVNSEEFQDE